MFRSTVDVVAVNAIVTDGGRPVVGLRAEDFEVWDAGVLQRVSLSGFSAAVDVVLVLDVSDSVKGAALRHLTAAGRALLASTKPEDRISLLTFSERIDQLATRSRNVSEVLARLNGVTAGGRTALYDGIYAGLSLVSANPVGRSLLLVFTDGVDNSSWIGSEELRRALQRNHSVVYIVARPELRTTLDDIATQTGGELFPAEADEGLARTFVRVMDSFRAGYLLTYSPEGVKRGDGWHPLKVQLRGRGGRVRARPGYYSR